LWNVHAFYFGSELCEGMELCASCESFARLLSHPCFGARKN
jgi:hypothetical protein